MEPSAVFKLLLGTNWALFIWDQYLHWRQYRVHLDNEKRPERVHDLITDEEYVKARNYKLDNHRYDFAHSWFGQVWTTVLLCSGMLPALWYACDGYPLQSIVFLLLLSVMSTVIDLPWDLYHTFVIEETHGFNKQTIAFFLKDLVKKFAVSQVIQAPIVLTVEWIVSNGGPYFYFYLWLFTSVVILLLMTIYPAYIAPLFDKYIPLPDGDLKTAIEALAASVEYPLTKLLVVYGSKRSSHSNAYMYGFWKNKRIVLFDTLLSGEEKEKVVAICAEVGEDQSEKDKERGMSNAEVVAVLGHELGHWALSHTIVNLFLTEANLLVMFAAFAYFSQNITLYKAFGFHDTPTIIGLMLVIQYVLALFHQVIGFLMSVHSRRCEFAADDYAQKRGHGDNLCTALTKLSKDNLSMPIDDPLYSMCNHSHPPIVERIAVIRKQKSD